ncbi:MAG: hypothetical protein K9M99_11760 [Candidatus Cloacimonetes bacterium]|nr:hypothetical protein [Candidatus Cloacimonadota bacterium]
MEILDIKAQNNLKIAKLAVDAKYFDVAVSRYYYYILLKIMIVLNERGINLDSKKDSTHNFTISEFLRLCKEDGIYNDDNNGRSLVKLWKLKNKRVSSEYSRTEIILSEDQFRTKFLYDYREVVAVLNKLSFLGEYNEK